MSKTSITKKHVAKIAKHVHAAAKKASPNVPSEDDLAALMNSLVENGELDDAGNDAD